MRSHSIAESAAMLSRTGWRFTLLVWTADLTVTPFTCVPLWQFAHTLVLGMLLWAPLNTPVWQYRQSSFIWPACRAWLKGTGWTGL